ncbi:uncharacterized protein LOC128884591 [Hylaeus volcanicus]|uniref:uncharacterized protein LOC128884591 n=1 Tax=Hylaeus volcanicus TaxID=313075 RepID=UPI0023B81F4D|nr:uncharacterized protein LOC128884591 [Hylaeus volcanicus]
MDDFGLILNLAQKATIKTEVDQENLTSCEILNNHSDASDPDRLTVIKNTFSYSLSEETCDDCKKKKNEEPKFKVALRVTDEDFDLGSDKENGPRRKLHVESKEIRSSRGRGRGRGREKCDEEEEEIFVLQQLGRSQIRSVGFPTFLCIDRRIDDSSGVKRKIPRPANAFMLFANEWRKKLASENPRESNKDISVRRVFFSSLCSLIPHYRKTINNVFDKEFAISTIIDRKNM